MRGSAVSGDEGQTSGPGQLEVTYPAQAGDTSTGGALTAKELDRLRVVQLVLQRRLTRVSAGASLGIGARQVARLCDAYQRQGAAGLISRKRGRVGNRKLAPSIEAQVVHLARQFYQDCGPTLVRKNLAEQHGIQLAKETVRKILSNAGLWFSKRRTPQAK
jgi:transposase